MSTPTAMAKKNLESSILFMQQEHAAILKGLHEEIAVLQKRCTDLTFQLTMHGLTIDEPGTIDSKMEEVHKELESSRQKITCLEKDLAERDKKIERLETEARTQRKRWLDESRSQSQAMNTLRAELEAKANNIAYLTTELHRLKQKQKANQSGAGNTSVTVHTSQGLPSQPGYLHPDSAQAGKRSQHFHPTPPSRDRTLGPGSAASRLRRSGHGSSKSVLSTGVTGKPMSTVHPASAETTANRQANPLRLSSGRSSGSESPDITPFLPQAKEEPIAPVAVKQAPILPPIPAQSSSTTIINPSGGTAHPVLVHQVVGSSSQQRQKNADTAIETLAVENIAPVWPLAHESHSAEYN